MTGTPDCWWIWHKSQPIAYEIFNMPQAPTKLGGLHPGAELAHNLLGSLSFPASSNGGVSSCFIKNVFSLQAFCDTSARISNLRYCMEAALYQHYLKVGFLCSPKFCGCWPLSPHARTHTHSRDCVEDWTASHVKHIVKTGNLQAVHLVELSGKQQSKMSSKPSLLCALIRDFAPAKRVMCQVLLIYLHPFRVAS